MTKIGLSVPLHLIMAFLEIPRTDLFFIEHRLIMTELVIMSGERWHLAALSNSSDRFPEKSE